MPDSRHDRREFITVTGAALAALAGVPKLTGAQSASAAQTAAASRRDPDLIVINAKVYTMDSGAPRGGLRRHRQALQGGGIDGGHPGPGGQEY